MSDKIKNIESAYLSLESKITFEKKAKARQAFQNFYESYNQLVERRNQYEKIKREKLSPKIPRSLHDIQIELVDKVSSFHQQVYSMISHFIKLLLHISPRSITSQMPFSKVTPFLKWWEKRTPEILESIKILESSRSFRPKCLAHPQNESLKNWITIGDSVYYHDSGKPSFQALSAGEGALAPSIEDVHIACLNFFEGTIRYIELNTLDKKA